MTIVGTRPELIKMSLVIQRLDRLTNHVLVHTGQNYDYELNKIFFEDLGIRKPDHFLGVAGQTPVQTIAKVLTDCDDLLVNEKPEAVLIYGDTNSGLAVMAAKRRKIPVFHMEAGNRCFDQRVPEELNRKVIDHLSDINMTLTEHARRYLLSEGLPAERTFKVGSHMAEVLEEFRDRISGSDALERLGLKAGEYFIFSIHREENVDDQQRINRLMDCLDAVADNFGFPVIVSTHPRTRKRIPEDRLQRAGSLVRFLPPFGFFDYVKLQQEAACVISDSGTITEEASLLNLKAVTLRDAHERPEGFDAGTLVMSSLHPLKLANAINCAMTPAYVNGSKKIYAGEVADYVAAGVSAKVVKIVLSYIDFVNREVWHKRDED